MDAQTALEFQYRKRIGFHYYPDTLHYRYQDLKNWLPELKAMQTSWLLLIAPPDRAIPEPFLRGLIQNKIEPVLHFTETPEKLGSLQNLELLIRAYSRWGIKKLSFSTSPTCDPHGLPAVGRTRTWSINSWIASSRLPTWLCSMKSPPYFLLCIQVEIIGTPYFCVRH